MSIKKAFPFNPIMWGICLFLNRIVSLIPSTNPPAIVYKEEFWFKMPEKTLKDGFGNCINIALLNYYAMENIFSQEYLTGIIYTNVGNQYHSEFVVFNKKTGLAEIYKALDVHFPVVYPNCWFVTKDGFYKLEGE